MKIKRIVWQASCWTVFRDVVHKSRLALLHAMRFNFFERLIITIGRANKLIITLSNNLFHLCESRQK
jgi:hypothetical protein